MKDLPKQLNIKVLKEDFKNADYTHNQDCPIARAVVRDLCIAPDRDLFGVCTYAVRFFDCGYEVFYYYPSDKDNEVQNICRGEEKPKDINIILTLKP